MCENRITENHTFGRLPHACAVSHHWQTLPAGFLGYRALQWPRYRGHDLDELRSQLFIPAYVVAGVILVVNQQKKIAMEWLLAFEGVTRKEVTGHRITADVAAIHQGVLPGEPLATGVTHRGDPIRHECLLFGIGMMPGTNCMRMQIEEAGDEKTPAAIHDDSSVWKVAPTFRANPTYATLGDEQRGFRRKRARGEIKHADTPQQQRWGRRTHEFQPNWYFLPFSTPQLLAPDAIPN